MDKGRRTMNKTEKLIGAIFAFIGAIFLIIGLVICINAYQKRAKWVETDAVVSEVIYRRDSEAVIVQYEVNGKTQEQKINGYSSGMVEGAPIHLWYNPENPAQIHTNALDMLHWMFIGMGGLFFAVGCSFFITPIIKGKKQKELLEQGEMVRADIVEIALNRAYSVNGRHPYYISCRWRNPENGQYYLFRSENLWYNPQDLLEEKQLKTLPVYLAPKNYKKYYICLDEIKVNDYQ